MMEAVIGIAILALFVLGGVVSIRSAPNPRLSPEPRDPDPVPMWYYIACGLLSGLVMLWSIRAVHATSTLEAAITLISWIAVMGVGSLIWRRRSPVRLLLVVSGAIGGLLLGEHFAPQNGWILYGATIAGVATGLLLFRAMRSARRPQWTSPYGRRGDRP